MNTNSTNRRLIKDIDILLKGIEMPDPSPEQSLPQKPKKVKPVPPPMPQHSPPAIAKNLVDTVEKAYQSIVKRDKTRERLLNKRLRQLKKEDVYEAVEEGVKSFIHEQEEKRKKGIKPKLPPSWINLKPRDWVQY